MKRLRISAPITSTLARAAGLDPGGGVRQRGHRAGAGRAHVDRGRVHGPQLVRHDGRGGGGDLIRGHGRDEEQVDLAGLEAGVPQSEVPGSGGEI